MPTCDFYPIEWSALTREIKAANSWRCQQCDLQCRRPGEMYLGWQYELTVAHASQDYEASEVFVMVLCCKCHFVHDAPFVWWSRRRHERLRRRQAGQLELMP
jgi:hypothetical protein